MFEFQFKPRLGNTQHNTATLFYSTWQSPTGHPATTRIAHPPPPPSPFHHTLTLTSKNNNNPQSLSLQNHPSTTMLCSAPTAKSGSKWLDRLRSSKGIPTGDGLDLDSFLLSTAHHSTTHSLHTRPTNPTRIRAPDTHSDRPSMTAVLAELFNMGATFTKTQPYKKCPRKQTHPKFFLASSSSSSSASPSAAATNTAVITAANSLRADVAEIAEEEETLDREEEGEGNELKGFTRSEVTMIDTSFPGWKVDKLVFRKNSVWKVRERKQKSKFLAKKKKKSTDNGSGIRTSSK